MDCRCDECLSWSSEMEAYVKLCKSLASKSKGKMNSSSIKSLSAPGVDFDRFLTHFAVFSQDVDNRIASMSRSIKNRLNEFFVNIEDRFANRSFSAEPGGIETYAAYWPVSAPASLCQHQCRPHSVLE